MNFNPVGLFSRVRGAMMTPVLGSAPVNGAFFDNTPPLLKPVLELTPCEELRQREIIVARRYHYGRHMQTLTKQLRTYLGDDANLFLPRLNYIAKVNRCLAARLVVESIASLSAVETEAANQSKWAGEVWGFDGGGSRMPQKRPQLHTALVRDGEAFLMVDYDAENGRARLTPHERYTDARVCIEGEFGDGEGVRMFYPNGDINQAPIYAAKHWTERVATARGHESIPHINLFYPERIYKYRLNQHSWELLEEIVWTRDGKENGEPLGIPFIHLRTPEMKPAAREGIPSQKAVNKLFLDMLASSNFDAFRLLVAFGWEAPSDIEPGTIIGTMAPKTEASLESIEPGDPTRQLELIDKTIAWMADVCNVPLALVQRSGQRAAEGTLQEEKEDFLNLCRDYGDGLKVSYADALRYARKLQNTFGSTQAMDEEPGFEVQLAEYWARTITDKQLETAAMLAAGFPEEEIWRDVWDKSQDDIDRILGTPAPQTQVGKQ